MKHSFRSISEDLFELHAELRRQWPCLLNVSVALYDDQAEQLHTFAKSSIDGEPLQHATVALSEATLLQEIAEQGEGRLISDISALPAASGVNAPQFYDATLSQFKSSYIEPFYLGGGLLGFVFYDASELDYFSSKLIKQLKLKSRLIESLIIAEILPIKFLLGLVDTTREIVHIRDNETGRHIMRVSSYVELMAMELAEEFDFTPDKIKYLWYYAPLHDIGKIAIPDGILLKPGKLSAEEIMIMKGHVAEGLRIIEMITRNFHFQHLVHFDMLKDLIGTHHECWDGTGYPNGLRGDEIPPAGRIMAIADVFDALVMDRVYRAGVPIADVFDFLIEKSGVMFDPVCVAAFVKNREKVEEIARDFRDELGASPDQVGEIR